MKLNKNIWWGRIIVALVFFLLPGAIFIQRVTTRYYYDNDVTIGIVFVCGVLLVALGVWAILDELIVRNHDD